MKYLHKELGKRVLELDTELTEENGYPLGSSYNDYLAKKWIELSDAQLVFIDANPSASVEEIINMSLNSVNTPTLEDVRARKLQELETVADNKLESLVGGKTVLRAITGFLDEVESTSAVAAIQNDIDALRTAYEGFKTDIEAAATIEDLEHIFIHFNV